MPLESLITYCVHKFCAPENLSIKFVNVPLSTKQTKVELEVKNSKDIEFTDNIPWQVKSCVFPVLIYGDTVIAGLCAVARYISIHRTSRSSPFEHKDGILGFRKSCLRAPNEVSIWTKFCEIDLAKSVKKLLAVDGLYEIPKNLVRFENHLKKPVRVHNVYKLAREIKKEQLKKSKESENKCRTPNIEDSKERVGKSRKWKSKLSQEIGIESSMKIEDLEISHQFAEGPFLTLADLILVPLYHIIMNLGLKKMFITELPLTSKWFKNVENLPELATVVTVLNGLEKRNLIIEDVVKPVIEDVSLYKCDPKRHNPKKRMFTKEDDIENSLNTLVDGMEFPVDDNHFEFGIMWDSLPNGANPYAGHLPDERMLRKSQQLENLALAVQKIASNGDLIVDFCSGSGHLGILIAYLLPKCTVILMENKDQSLLRARERVLDMNLKNVYIFQCNLDFFIGKFDIGIALHACGIASDLVLDKCLKAKAKFVLCPCCYGSIHYTDRLVYPRSSKFGIVAFEQYLTIAHAADQTHEEHPLAVRGAKCMAVIDSDRGRLAEEIGYNVTLTRLKPLSCTPKNNLLIGVPV